VGRFDTVRSAVSARAQSSALPSSGLSSSGRVVGASSLPFLASGSLPLRARGPRAPGAIPQHPFSGRCDREKVTHGLGNLR